MTGIVRLANVAHENSISKKRLSLDRVALGLDVNSLTRCRMTTRCYPSLLVKSTMDAAGKVPSKLREYSERNLFFQRGDSNK